jgi:hypothetical protein
MCWDGLWGLQAAYALGVLMSNDDNTWGDQVWILHDVQNFKR